MAIQTNERYSMDESVYVPLKNGRIIMQAGRLNNERKPEQMPNKIKIKIKTNENDKIQIQHYQHKHIHITHTRTHAVNGYRSKRTFLSDP